MILFVGQVAREMRGREAFQELDYRAVFGSIAKWVTEIDDAARLPELIARAFHVAMSGRPGPVVIALPEDMLRETADCADAAPVNIRDAMPAEADLDRLEAMLEGARRPLIIAGGSRWDEAAVRDLTAIAARYELPVSVAFRRQSLFSATEQTYAGDIGVGANPALVAAARESDLIILLGTRLSETASQGYTLLGIPRTAQGLVHVHPGAEELGRVYQADLALNVSPRAFLEAMRGRGPRRAPDRAEHVARLHAAYLAWSGEPTKQPGALNLGEIVAGLSQKLPDDAIITNGAGNYATWINRFYRFRGFGSLVAPTSGSMGYGVPAAVGALRLDPSRPVVAFAGDGCFLMNGQEFATAVQYDLPLIVIVVDNGMYGTIRMHQERDYPERVVGTALKNPDFAAYAKAFGGHGERVESTGDFWPAFERAVAAKKPAILHCLVDPEALTPARSLSAIRDAARK